MAVAKKSEVLAVRLPIELRDQIRSVAESEERTMTKVIERAIREYVERAKEATAS